VPHALQPDPQYTKFTEFAKASMLPLPSASAPLISPFGPLSEPQNVIGDRSTVRQQHVSASSNEANEESKFRLEGDRTVDRHARLWSRWESPHQENPTKLIKTYKHLIFIYLPIPRIPKTKYVKSDAEPLLPAPISFIHFPV
jgi:hypothetical protein